MIAPDSGGADVERLKDSLGWALSHGGLTYHRRNKQNADYCDAVDRARRALEGEDEG